MKPVNIFIIAAFWVGFIIHTGKELVEYFTGSGKYALENKGVSDFIDFILNTVLIVIINMILYTLCGFVVFILFNTFVLRSVDF